MNYELFRIFRTSPNMAFVIDSDVTLTFTTYVTLTFTTYVIYY